jgi:hypothetical protein
MDASYEKEPDCYCFNLNRSNVLLNDKKPETLTDRILYEIGTSLYPLKLKVSPFLQIIDVNNREEIYSRWKKCTEKCLQKNNTELLRNYVHTNEAIFSKKERFIELLYRDTFVKLYFRNIYRQTDEKEAILIRWDNFPESKMNSSYLYQLEKTDSMIQTSGKIMKILPHQEGFYQMKYKVGTRGEIFEICGTVDNQHNGKKYAKQIAVTSENMNVFDLNYKNIILEE